MRNFARALRHRYADGLTDSAEPATARIRTLAGSTHVLWLSWAYLAVLPSQVQAQEAPGGQEPTSVFMLEAGIVGDSRCSGRYVGINGRVAGPVSLYGMVETYQCAAYSEDLGGNITAHYPHWTGLHNQIGVSVLFGRSSWFVRPALRVGIQCDGGDHVEATGGASVTFGRRWGARFIVLLDECGSTVCERFQMGGYASF